MRASPTNAIIARLAPRLAKAFEGRAMVDFRVLPGEPERLTVTLRFSRLRAAAIELTSLEAVAEGAGLDIGDSGLGPNLVWIEIPADALAQPRCGTVVAFRPRAQSFEAGEVLAALA